MRLTDARCLFLFLCHDEIAVRGANKKNLCHMFYSLRLYQIVFRNRIKLAIFVRKCQSWRYISLNSTTKKRTQLFWMCQWMWHFQHMMVVFLICGTAFYKIITFMDNSHFYFMRDLFVSLVYVLTSLIHHQIMWAKKHIRRNIKQMVFFIIFFSFNDCLLINDCNKFNGILLVCVFITIYHTNA